MKTPDMTIDELTMAHSWAEQNEKNKPLACAWMKLMESNVFEELEDALRQIDDRKKLRNAHLINPLVKAWFDLRERLGRMILAEIT